jgi:hypothetical protein
MDMPKATRIDASIPASIPVSSESPKKYDEHPLVSIALFCAIGLLVSLVAAIAGVEGAWY